MKDIVLALGGGGVKGHAHIGVLRVLEREGYRVRAIAGTSAGGLAGVFYAFGYTPDDILARFSDLDQNTLYNRDPEDGPGWLGTTNIRRVLEDAIGDCTFADLRLPFAVTAVDLDTAEHVVLQRGRVVDAICATIAVPGVFPPARWDGRLLVDGGLLDPVPVAVARSLAPGLPVAAVVLSPPMVEWAGVEKPRLLESMPFLSRYLGRLRIAQAVNIFMHSIDISGTMLTELLLQLDAPDVLVRPPLPQVGLLDKVDVAQVADIGARAMEQALPELKRATRLPSWAYRWLHARRRRPGLPYSTGFEGKDVT